MEEKNQPRRWYKWHRISNWRVWYEIGTQRNRVVVGKGPFGVEDACDCGTVYPENEGRRRKRKFQNKQRNVDRGKRIERTILMDEKAIKVSNENRIMDDDRMAATCTTGKYEKDRDDRRGYYRWSCFSFQKKKLRPEDTTWTMYCTVCAKVFAHDSAETGYY